MGFFFNPHLSLSVNLGNPHAEANDLGLGFLLLRVNLCSLRQTEDHETHESCRGFMRGTLTSTQEPVCDEDKRRGRAADTDATLSFIVTCF